MSEILLSRLSITGFIDLNTPQVVIVEIAEAHGLSFHLKDLISVVDLSHLIYRINTTPCKTIGMKYANDTNSLRLVAKFINPHTSQWSVKQLISAFQFLLLFYHDHSLPKDDFTAGLQTPENPYTLNACVLYALCRHHGIQTTFQTRIQDMAMALRLLQKSKIQAETFLRDPSWTKLYNGLIGTLITHDLAPNQYINLALLLNSNLLKTSDKERMNSNYQFNFMEGQTLAERWSHPNHYFGSIPNTFEVEPKTPMEAVVAAAIKYGMDITRAVDPMLEYEQMEKGECIVDRDLVKRLKERKKFENPRLWEMFNPELPEKFYSSPMLIHFCRQEGFSEDEIQRNNPYSLLVEVFRLNNFYPGTQTSLINTENVYCEEFKDLNPHQVVCYGVWGTPLKAYTYDELNAVFSKTFRFRDPMTDVDTNRSNLSLRSVDKLEYLANEPKKRGEEEEWYQERKKLYKTMQMIRLLNKKCSDRAETFTIAYNMSTINVKENIDMCLRCLLEAGMYMRSWIGHGKYPISSVETNYTEEMRVGIDLRVTESLIRWDRMVEKIKDEIYNISTYPLISYSNGNFMISTDERDGYNIGDRIRIIRQGSTNSNIKSCIRLSSNWLVSSAYYYMLLTGQDPGFDIKELASIS